MAPLCACGCKRPLSLNRKRQSQFIRGHGNLKTIKGVAVPEGHKCCVQCETVKPLDQFYKRSRRPAYTDGRNVVCGACLSFNLRLRRVGITKKEYDELWKAQNGLCKICFALATVIDHCHKTQKVRGLLCTNCNLVLGHAEDNPAILQAAITYLQES